MIAQAVTTAFKHDLLRAAAGDAYKIALYTSEADLSKDTTDYTTDGEVPTNGSYHAGGLPIELVLVEQGERAWLQWAGEPRWARATITARGALVYNTSRHNQAVLVLDFGENISSRDGPFTIEFPDGPVLLEFS